MIKRKIFILLTLFLALTMMKCSEILSEDITGTIFSLQNNSSTGSAANNTNHGIEITITDNNGNQIDAITNEITISFRDNIDDHTVVPLGSNISFDSDTSTLTINIIDPNSDGNLDDNEAVTITDSNAPIAQAHSLLVIKTDENGDLLVIKGIINAEDFPANATYFITNTNITQNTIVETSIERTIGDDGTFISIETETETAADGTKTITVTDPDGASYSCPNQSYIPIINANTLQNIELDKNYCLSRDITLTGDFDPIGYPDASITVLGSFRATKFTGILDGDNKKISGLSIQKENASFVGLFAKIGAGGEVKNLIIENPDIHGKDRVGALAGESSGTITNVGIEGTSDVEIVKGKGSNTGGLVGYNDEGTITGSHATGAVNGGDWYTGGLVGGNDEGTITNSYAMGNVTGETRYTGGLVGYNDEGTITGSHATGAVNGGEYGETGGLAGYNLYGTIENSYATGEVNGEEHGKTGGLVGYNLYGTIENSYATGEVNGEEHGKTGGLVGYNLYGTIENSYATGEVNGGEHGDAGGLVGENLGGTITGSYATGEITGTTQTGGLVGKNLWDGRIENSYATGAVNGGEYGDTGGLVGENLDGRIENSYATGAVNGGEYGDTGGLVGDDYGNIENSYFDVIGTGQGKGIGDGNNSQRAQGIRSTEITEGGEEQFKTGGGWDFDTIWKAVGDGQWPELQWQP